MKIDPNEEETELPQGYAQLSQTSRAAERENKFNCDKSACTRTVRQQRDVGPSPRPSQILTRDTNSSPGHPKTFPVCPVYQNSFAVVVLAEGLTTEWSNPIFPMGERMNHRLSGCPVWERNGV